MIKHIEKYSESKYFVLLIEGINIKEFYLKNSKQLLSFGVLITKLDCDDSDFFSVAKKFFGQHLDFVQGENYFWIKPTDKNILFTTLSFGDGLEECFFISEETFKTIYSNKIEVNTDTLSMLNKDEFLINLIDMPDLKIYANNIELLTAFESILKEKNYDTL